MDVDGWVRALERRLPSQGRLLSALVSAVKSDPTWEWLELSCSIARGEGDEESDLDVGLGYVGDDSPDPAWVTAMVESLGPLVDVSVQPWEQWHRWWAQYADGGQLDLVMLPADLRPGRAPQSVVLLDRADRLGSTFTPGSWQASPDSCEGWLFDGWEALSNVAKYLRRGSLHEAFDQLSRARADVFRLWAAGEGIPYPTFGVTSLLDEPGATLPPAIKSTYALPEAAPLLAAALALTDLLPAAAEHAQPGLDTPLRPYVTAKLHGVR